MRRMSYLSPEWSSQRRLRRLPSSEVSVRVRLHGTGSLYAHERVRSVIGAHTKGAAEPCE